MSGHLELQVVEIDRDRKELHNAFERELATTKRVLAAFPHDQSELRPHPRAKSARELAWMLVLEQRLCDKALSGTLDLATAFTPAPESFAQIVSTFEREADGVVAAIQNSHPKQLRGSTRFFVAPQTLGDIPNVEFLWFVLHDHIHHRGQFSVYLRMAGGMVPSIYGPSADEPWT